MDESGVDNYLYTSSVVRARVLPLRGAVISVFAFLYGLVSRYVYGQELVYNTAIRGVLTLVCLISLYVFNINSTFQRMNKTALCLALYVFVTSYTLTAMFACYPHRITNTSGSIASVGVLLSKYSGHIIIL